MAAVLPVAAPRSIASGGVDHLYCCDRSLALCGADITDTSEVDDADCVVCLDLDRLPCPRCGWQPVGGEGW